MLDGLFRHSADSETLTWEQYSKACVQDEALISHLGHKRLAAAVPVPAAAATAEGEAQQKQQKQMGQLTFFGHRRWEMMLSLMVGLQLAVEHTAAIDATDAADLIRAWSTREDDEASSVHASFGASRGAETDALPRVLHAAMTLLSSISSAASAAAVLT